MASVSGFNATYISNNESRLDFVVLSDLNGTTINCFNVITGVNLSSASLQLHGKMETIYMLKFR